VGLAWAVPATQRAQPYSEAEAADSHRSERDTGFPSPASVTAFTDNWPCRAVRCYQRLRVSRARQTPKARHWVRLFFDKSVDRAQGSVA